MIAILLALLADILIAVIAGIAVIIVAITITTNHIMASPSVKNDRTFGTNMATIESESVWHRFFMSTVRGGELFLSNCSMIFDFQRASSSIMGASFKFS
jgi:hypothetical protein